MILSLRHLIPRADCQTTNSFGMWIRAVPTAPSIWKNRLKDAWAVIFDENVFAVRWPRSGEFEEALSRDPDSGPNSGKPNPKPLPNKNGVRMK